MRASTLRTRWMLLSGCVLTVTPAVFSQPQTRAQTSEGTALESLSADDWAGIRGAYESSVDPLAQQAYLKASNSGPGDEFGISVTVSGDTVVVGAWEEDSNATAVNGDQDNDDAPRAGAVYVFVRSGANWSQQAYLKASNSGPGDEFGISVALAGDTLVVGALGEDSNANGVDGDQTNDRAMDSGAAYVFVRSGTRWSQQAYLKASNTGVQDNFGFSVAVSGDTLVVGANLEDSAATGVGGDEGDVHAHFNAGAAYVFVRSGTSWSQQAYLKASNTNAHDVFGNSVAVTGDTLVVGARKEASNATGVGGNEADNSAASAGAAYVFVRSGTSWSQQAYLKAFNTDGGLEGGDEFGWAVATSGDTVVVGAFLEDGSDTGANGDDDNLAEDAGAAYVFVRSGTTWNQEAYLKASNTGAGDWFGHSVGVSGETVVVGAHREDSDATGVDGEESNDDAPDAGAAYVFVRSGTRWSQEAYLKASTTEAFDGFGNSVSASGDVVVVGGYREDSDAACVHGDQGDNSATWAGAGYVFDHAVPPGAPRSFCSAKRNSADCVPTIRHEGTATLGCSDDFFVRADGVVAQTQAFLLFGLDRNPVAMSGPAGIRGLFGPSPRGARYCILRPSVVDAQLSGGTSGNCDGTLSFHFSQAQMASQGLLAGMEALFQVVYRDPDHGDGTGIGHTSALAFTILP